MIVGIVGFMGSGKNTVGDILVGDYGFQKDSFAKPLKDAAAIIFNWPRELLEGDTKESRLWRDKVDEWWSKELGWQVTPRAVLQKMGTEAGRNVFGNKLWTSALINRLSYKYINYVITDVRFDNEIQAIRDVGGLVIRIKRGDDPIWFKDAQLYLKTYPNWSEYVHEPTKEKIHISEYGWVNSVMDHVLDNNGTQQNLIDTVHSYMETLDYYTIPNLV